MSGLDVFISYKREERDKANAICAALERYGYTVWFDTRLLSGDRFRQEIKKQIDAAKAVVVLWSQRSVQSQFVIDEASYADRNKKLCPAMLDCCDIPFGFGAYHAVSLAGWSGDPLDDMLTNLLTTLEAKTGKAAALVNDGHSTERNTTKGNTASGDFDDLFSDVFKDPKSWQKSGKRGEDLRYRLTVEFEDTILGGKQTVQFADGPPLSVTIPAGITSGKLLRLRSQGLPGTGGAAAGDAILEITVKDHPLYKRIGDDLHVDLPVSLTEAVEGARIEVPSPLGKKLLTIPPGMHGGKTLRMRGLGVQKPDLPGDLYYRLHIELPPQPNRQLRSFVRKWEDRVFTPDRF
ncbi:MAG: hypothetical protein CMK09_17145 [Ponticaulis sp.]|nr:hypothetical protein [Ponticaulis sp.]|tara:strand:+ start:6338 stop:7384 length:1047 start_codon:yes stop_codon:yes gene_type:complete